MSSVGAPIDPSQPWDPPAQHDGCRITTVYATPWQLPARGTLRGTPPADVFNLSRLAGFYRTSSDQLPRVLAHGAIDPETLEFRRWTGGASSARGWLFTLPSGQVLAGLTLDIEGGPVETIPLLEDLYYLDTRLGGASFLAWCHAQTSVTYPADSDRGDFLPERHQLLFAGAAAPPHRLTQDQLQRIIYRADLPSRSEDGSIRYPGELNRRNTSAAALGPYVTVIAGHQEYIENAALLSAVEVVGGAARLRDIRQRAYECVGTFRAHLDDQLPVRDRRLILEDIADVLGELELELSFSVEAAADLGLLIPSLRVESYHEALYESMNLARRTRTTGHMLDRLRNAIDSELTSVTSVEERANEERRVRTAVAVTFVTTVGGTLAILFGFFGINAREVSQTSSMFALRYMPIYITIASIVVIAIGIYAVPAWRNRLRRLATG